MSRHLRFSPASVVFTLTLIFTGVLLNGTRAECQTNGPTSVYFLTCVKGLDYKIFGIQGKAVKVQVPQTFPGHQFALAVGNTMRILGYNAPVIGHEYNLQGKDTGTTYPPPLLDPNQLTDGATDGTTNNFTLDGTAGNVYQLDRNWANPRILFNLGGGDAAYVGITFDARNGSLWVSGYNKTTVEDRAFNGQLLKSFDTGHKYNNALAIDYADDPPTLWLYNGRTLLLEQYKRDGTALGTVAIPVLQEGYNCLGGEFRNPSR